MIGSAATREPSRQSGRCRRVIAETDNSEKWGNREGNLDSISVTAFALQRYSLPPKKSSVKVEFFDVLNPHLGKIRMIWVNEDIIITLDHCRRNLQQASITLSNEFIPYSFSRQRVWEFPPILRQIGYICRHHFNRIRNMNLHHHVIRRKCGECKVNCHLGHGQRPIRRRVYEFNTHRIPSSPYLRRPGPGKRPGELLLRKSKDLHITPKCRARYGSILPSQAPSQRNDAATRRVWHHLKHG